MISAQPITTIPTKKLVRVLTGIEEFDKLMGGGFVPGSAILFAGEPGVGKSTLLLQLADKVATHDKVLYISGEESLQQMKMRADRLGATNPQIFCSENIALEDVLLLIEKIEPKLLIIDSLQMVYARNSALMPGSPSQMKKSLLKLIEIVKRKDIILVTIGHSTKAGTIAGLLTLQHMVDTTLFMSLAGDGIRLLEAKKNRFGATEGIWEVEMAEHGFRGINENVTIMKDENYGVEKFLEDTILGAKEKSKNSYDRTVTIITWISLFVLAFIAISLLGLGNILKTALQAIAVLVGSYYLNKGITSLTGRK